MVQTFRDGEARFLLPVAVWKVGSIRGKAAPVHT